MADIAIGVFEYEKHKRNNQEQQQQQQLRGLHSTSSAQLYHLPQQKYQQQQQQQSQNGYLLVDQQQQQQQQQQSLVGQTAPQQQNYDNTSQQQQQQLPIQQLSFQELNPFPESVFSYTLFLACTLMVWVLHLVLPRGVRKQYLGANRKRYAKRHDDSMPAAGYWMSVQSLKAQSASTTPGFGENGSIVGSVTNPAIVSAAARHKNIPSRYGDRHNDDNNDDQHRTPPPASPPRSAHQSAMLKYPPSPEHPALKKIPPNKIIAETMARLQGRGIRLVAHGVHCDPKRVWIRLQETEEGVGSADPSVTWQTEFPRRVPDQNGNVSIVLMRGSLHSIALKNILYIDVGKKTHALQLAKGVASETTCLSLLTQNGSLDLQANSKLERDSLVSCFSMILDDIHQEDWRALYEASPEPSLANSSTFFGSSGGHSLIGTNNTNRIMTYNLDASNSTPGSFLTTPSPHHYGKNNNTSINSSGQQQQQPYNRKVSPTERDRMLQLL